MAYSESLAGRVRDALLRERRIEEKKMFGGVCFMLNGNLLVGVWKHSLIARLGPDAAEAALREPYVTRFDITGKPMKAWVLIEPEGIETDHQLKHWIDRAIQFVKTLPAK